MADPDKIKAYGLTQVYCSEEPPLVDIVFVHGLNGHPGHTWTSKSGVFWPAALLPEVLGRVRILTYGYNAEVVAFKDGSSRDHIHHHSETLASGLAANRNLRRCADRPLIFVCHSLGGLVVKRTLIYCRGLANEKIEHLRSVFVSTYGILFLGTPHNGSDVARWGTLLENICSAVLPKKVLESSSQLINSLRTNNETLQNINGLFAEVLPRYHIYFFHETRSTDVKGTRQLIVDESSAAPYVDGVERMGIEADHSSMCKFEDENAPGYEAVAEALLRYSEGAPALIKDRWAEEASSRDIAKRAKAREIYPEGGANAAAGSESDLHHVGGTSAPSHLDQASAVYPNIPLISSVPMSGGLPPGVQPMPVPLAPGYVYVSPPPLPLDVGSPPMPAPSAAPEIEELPDAPEPFFLVPPGFHPNANFLGMEKELKKMHGRLYKASKRVDRLTAVLVHGLPGSGKTHLVRQYMWAQRDCFPGGIFWVDARSRDLIYKGYLEIAQTVSLIPDDQSFDGFDPMLSHRLAEDVRNWFQSREDWLIIFDGINFDYDDDISVFNQILPFRKRSSIIYTSINKTLARKQRLYEPYCLSVRPLRLRDARNLLFRDIGIKDPNDRQIRKANELVNHHERLPLAVHAISHNLSATGKPIEMYHIKPHITDTKLAQPYLGIVRDLQRTEHYTAINLLNVLAFLGHQVPVGMIHLGKAALDAREVQVMTSGRPGDRADIDTTIGALIRCGLLERTSYTQQQSFTSSSDGGDTPADASRSTPLDSSGSVTEEIESVVESVEASSAIDVIRVHSVVQSFCRNELYSMDRESGVSRSGRQSVAGYHDSWLIVATELLCAAYDRAKAKMIGLNYNGSAKDYREFEAHGRKLISHFPWVQKIEEKYNKAKAKSEDKDRAKGKEDEKKDEKEKGIERERQEEREREREREKQMEMEKEKKKSPEAVQNAYDDLEQVLGRIFDQLRQLSRSSSIDTFPGLKSIFDRNSSSSSSQPDSSSADDYYTREQTMNFTEPNTPQVESPQEMSPGIPLDPPPRLYRDPTGTGYETDGEGESSRPRIRRPGRLAQMIRATEVPPEDLSDYQLEVNPPSSPKTSEERLRLRGFNNFPPRVGSPKPASPILRVIQVHGQNAPNDSPTSGRRGSQGSTASDALANIHSASPASSHGSNATAALGSPPESKENIPPSNAIARSARANEVTIEPAKPRPVSVSSRRRPATSGRMPDSSVESLPSQIGRVSRSAMYTPGRSDRMSRSLCSEAGPEILSQKLSSLELRRSNDMHNSELYAPSMLRPHTSGDMSGSASSVFAIGSQHMQMDDSVEIRQSRRMSGTSRTGNVNLNLSIHLHHPSAFMPGSSPPSAADMPHACASDPIITDQPMSRGPSGHSRHSWATDPVLYPSGPQVTQSPQYPQNASMAVVPATNSPAMIGPLPPAPVSGAGTWSTEIPQTATLHPESAYTAHAAHAAHAAHTAPMMQQQQQAPPPPPHEYFESPQGAHAFYFGHQAVDLPGARSRLFHQQPQPQPTFITSPPPPLPPHVPAHAPAPGAAYPMYHANYSTPMFSHARELMPPLPPSRGFQGTRGRSGSSSAAYEGYRK